MNLLVLALSALVCSCLTSDVYSAPPICKENSLSFVSHYALGRQNDLNETFDDIQTRIKIPEISYTPRLGKTYKILNFAPVFTVIDSKQRAQFIKVNDLRVSGGVLRMTYKFDWEKKQLGSSVKGTAEGVVLSDSISFDKVLEIVDDEPQWVLGNHTNITFTNSFSVTKVTPYNQNDSDTLFVMLNKAMDHPSGKVVVGETINGIYPFALNKSIMTDGSDLQVNKTIEYNYHDYRGQFKVIYDNIDTLVSIDSKGLTYLFIQQIKGDEGFECGDPVPEQAQDDSIYGGHQSYLSHALLKSTVKYALSKNFFDVALSQQNWQSRAFQFFVGDLYEAIPSLKNESAWNPLTGTCRSSNDDSFTFARNNAESYKVTMNFSCKIEGGTLGTVAEFTILTTNIVKVNLRQKYLEFTLDKVTGKPVFKASDKYNITNTDFANFLVAETLKVAEGAPLFGTGYPTSTRAFPNLEVLDKYLFLYDSSVKPHASRAQII